MIQLEVSDITMQIKVGIDNSLPRGIAGLSFNLPGMPYLRLPGWGKLVTSSK